MRASSLDRIVGDAHGTGVSSGGSVAVTAPGRRIASEAFTGGLVGAMKPYHGYTATVWFEPEDRLFHGHVAGIRHIVHFAGSSVDELERAFHDSVDDYLAWAEADGFQPQRPEPQPEDATGPRPHDTDDLVREAARMDNQSIERWTREALIRAARERLRRAG